MSKRSQKRERRDATWYSGNQTMRRVTHGDRQASGNDRDHAGAGADSGADANADPFAGACAGTVPVLGWKALAVRETGALYSPNVMVAWPSYRRLEAKGCAQPLPGSPGQGWTFLTYYSAHTVPVPSPTVHEACHPACNCGIHLGLGIDHAWPYVNLEALSAVSRVYGWGRVVANEAGYRVQYAYPETVCIIGRPNNAELGWLADRVRLRYGVPVEVVSRKAMLDMAAAEAAEASGVPMYGEGSSS